MWEREICRTTNRKGRQSQTRRSPRSKRYKIGGFEVHRYRDDIFRDRIVVSFCNAAFLLKLARIIYHGRWAGSTA